MGRALTQYQQDKAGVPWPRYLACTSISWVFPQGWRASSSQKLCAVCLISGSIALNQALPSLWERTKSLSDSRQPIGLVTQPGKGAVSVFCSS
jgi:hypothetical protein